MRNLFGYGSTSTMPMVRNCNIEYSEEKDLWVLVGKCEGCNIVLTDENKDLVINKWKNYLSINRTIEYDPEYI